MHCILELINIVFRFVFKISSSFLRAYSLSSIKTMFSMEMINAKQQARRKPFEKCYKTRMKMKIDKNCVQQWKMCMWLVCVCCIHSLRAFFFHINWQRPNRFCFQRIQRFLQWWSINPVLSFPWCFVKPMHVTHVHVMWLNVFITFTRIQHNRVCVYCIYSNLFTVKNLILPFSMMSLYWFLL